MFLNEFTKEPRAFLSGIDSLYISDRFIELVSQGSCDCDEIVIADDNRFFLLTSHPLGEDGYVEIKEFSTFEAERFPYEVDLTGEKFKFDKLCFLETGLIEGIRFCAEDAFLFIFASEHNLVLTKSKYDLFYEIEADYPDAEERLIIRKRKQ